LEDAAQRLYIALGEPKFRTALQSRFRLNSQPLLGPIRHIFDLANGLIITTNYDRVVEVAWKHALTTRGVQSDIEQLLATSLEDLARALKGSGHAVLKIHGDIERSETWVLTSDRYTAMYDSAAFQRFLSRFFSAHIPLFIGCSMTEERLLNAMEDNECIGYAILPAPLSDTEHFRVVSRLKDRLRVIWLRHEDVSGTGSIYDVLEPVLHWLSVHRKVGRVAWEADTRPAISWTSVIEQFERRGEFESALEWIRRHWHAWGSWELAVEYLRFSDLAGDPTGWRTYLDDFRPSLRDEPALVTQHALDYFYGRLLGQSGQWGAAFGRHAANRPRSPGADRYQVLSWFEEGQLRFRTEDFERAEAVFGDVYCLLMNQPAHARALVDVLKFLGTLQVLDTIYDAPASEGLWIRGQHSNPDLALTFSEAALREAIDAKYPDGQAWALCVVAFAHEAKGDVASGEDYYKRALEVVRTSTCRSATKLHILLYQAAFLRRRNLFSAATDTLAQAALALPPTGRAPDRLRLAEQNMLLAWALDDQADARRQFGIIADAHAVAPILLDGSTRLERRMQRLQADPRFAS
jgi:tetratricopeptide (TPR) repeat protein